jgi:hypothetical protein
MALLISELFKASRAFAASEVLLQIIKLLWIVSVAIDAHIHKTSFVAKMFVFVENRSPLRIVADLICTASVSILCFLIEGRTD